MPEVCASVHIAAPVERVYQLAKDIEGLAHFIHEIESVTVVEREGDRTVTDWVGVIKELFGRKVHWREVDRWDDRKRECRFEQQEGEFDEYRGVWRFQPEGEGTRSVIELTYRLEVPLSGPLIRKMIHAVVQRSCDNILKGLQQRALEEG